MSDGLNQVRAMRVSEIMTDYRNIQQYISGIRANPSAEEYNEDGFVLLRRCVGEAHNLLQQPFSGPPSSSVAGDVEATRVQLQRIIVDASVRRFRAKRLYLQATAALRWVNSRAQILQGQRPHAGHAPALAQVRNTLRQELLAITDQRVELTLRSADSSAGKWLQEDPPLSVVQRLASEGSSR